jgi:anti-anti-sigma factor
MTTPTPLLRVTRFDDGVTARVCGTALTEVEAADLGREFDALVVSRPRPVVTVDLAAVSFLGSPAVGRLVALAGAVRAAGGWVTLTNLTPDLRRVFAVCRLDRTFHLGAGAVRPTADAVRALAYRKWEDAGRPTGDGAGFWFAAEADVFQD